jgi:phage gpG-like protein
MKIKVKSDFRPKRVTNAAKKGNFNSLGHAAASIRRAAMSLIRRSKRPARKGDPPKTRRGKLKRAIFFDIDRNKETAVIGPSAAKVGKVGGAHEHGGIYKGADFPRRPFMGPALETSAPRLPRHWRGSIVGP